MRRVQYPVTTSRSRRSPRTMARIHKVRKLELLEEALDEEIEEALTLPPDLDLDVDEGPW